MTYVATTIQQTRIDAGLSQVELAERAGTSQSALARYETGAVLPTLPTLERLLLACGRYLQIRSVGTDQGLKPTSLRGQVGALADSLRHHRRQLITSGQTHGVDKVRVFGSLARGEASPSSDIDLLVELKPGRTLLDLAAFKREAQEILGTRVDVATSDMLKEQFRGEVLDEALPL